MFRQKRTVRTKLPVAKPPAKPKKSKGYRAGRKGSRISFVPFSRQSYFRAMLCRRPMRGGPQDDPTNRVYNHPEYGPLVTERIPNESIEGGRDRPRGTMRFPFGNWATREEAALACDIMARKYGDLTVATWVEECAFRIVDVNTYQISVG